MKNNNLFILMAAVFALISCGTANRSAYYSGPQLRNSIYYTPDNRNSQEYAQEQQYRQNLQERTSAAIEKPVAGTTYSTGPDTRTVYIGDSNQVDIEYRPGTTYSIVDDPESYEARLRKFDSPTYTININFDSYDPYPWYSYRYGWYGYRPWYSSWYSWYSPRWSWDWHYNWNWGWYDPFYDPWWGHAYWPGYHYPGHWYGHYYPGYWPEHHHHGYWPGHGPGARPDHGRDVYYGKRNSSSSYRDPGRTGTVAGNHNPAGRPQTGSVTRKPTSVNQINKGTRKPEMNVAGNNQYRRVAPKQDTKGNTGTSVNKNQSQNKNTSASYRRSEGNNNSSSYNRSSSSQQRSSFSSGSSSGGGRSYSSGSSGSSGSSYRRR